ncbi:MAG: LysR family transcriptional regulator substrate-binding protein, partial [Lachnospiraceae bacterium]|nr:LysR family transcriptional regulator substrate-binding protein [Lachnospiraceae bacterium]
HDTILPILHDFQKKMPDMELQIINDTTPDLITDVSESRVDLAIITIVPTGKGGISCTEWMSFQDILVAGRDFAELKGRIMTLAEINDYPLISPWRGTETYQFYHGFFKSKKLKFHPEIETATTDQVLSFTVNNMGLGFVSSFVAKEALEQGRVFQIPLKEEIPSRKISILQRSDGSAASATSNIRQLLLDAKIHGTGRERGKPVV